MTWNRWAIHGGLQVPKHSDSIETQVLNTCSLNAVAVLGTNKSPEQRMTISLKNKENRIRRSLKTWIVTGNAIMGSAKPRPKPRPKPSLSQASRIPWAVCSRSKRSPDSTRARQTGCTAEACRRVHHARRKERLDPVLDPVSFFVSPTRNLVSRSVARRPKATRCTAFALMRSESRRSNRRSLMYHSLFVGACSSGLNCRI